MMMMMTMTTTSSLAMDPRKKIASKFGQPNFLGDASGVCSYLGEKNRATKVENGS